MTRRCFGPGMVACCAQLPARSSKASASGRCNVRRNAGSEGTTPVTPSRRRVCSSASAAHPAIAVNERAPGYHRTQCQAQDHRQPVAHTPAMPRISHLGQHPQQPRLLFGGIPASSTRWPIAGSISDDGGAGMAPREAIWLA
jgi:hypothetical protein